MIAAGLDVGTTGCKIAVFDENGTLLKTDYEPYEARHQNGCHEIDFADVWTGVLAVLGRAAREYRLTVLGVTSFGETFVMLDDRDRILAPSMLYTDPRGQAECDALCRTVGAAVGAAGEADGGLRAGAARLTAITGVKPHPMYSMAKLLWLRAHEPARFARCRRILLGQDYIVYRLTGQAQIDESLAARTAAFDIRGRRWSDMVVEAAGLDPALLSCVVPAGTAAGGLRPEIREALGIGYDFTVVNGCHDQVAAMLGSGVFGSDCAMDGTGTVECIPVLLEEVPTEPALYEGGYSVVPYPGGKYACYALSFTGGASLKWFRDRFAPGEAYAALDAAVPDAPTGLLLLPHFAGAATPYMDPASTGAVVGLTLETTRYDLYKALMEGTSYEMRLNFSVLRRYTGDIREIRATGGGAASDVWLQIKADILGTAVTALACREVGAAGTAALAGRAVGLYPDLAAAVSRMAPPRRVFLPDAERRAQYDALYRRYEHLYAALKSL